MKGKEPDKDFWFEMCMNNVVRYKNEETGKREWYEEYITLYSTKMNEQNKWIGIRDYTLEDLLELRKRFKDHMKLMEKALDAKIEEFKKVKEMDEKYNGEK